MQSDHSTSPTSSEDEETKFFKLERVSSKSKPRSCSVSSETLQPIPEVGAEEEGLGNFIRRSGSITHSSKSKRVLRKSVSPKNSVNLEQWSYGVDLKDDYCEVQRSYSCIPAFDKGAIPEEDTEGDRVTSPRIFFMVDKSEKMYDKKRRPLYDSSESIQEERNEEEKVQIFRHGELIIGHCDEFDDNRSGNVFVIPPDSIKEEDEGVEERVMLKHDDFLKRIAMNDEQYLPTGEIMRSSLQEVWEEDEDQGLGGG